MRMRCKYVLGRIRNVRPAGGFMFFLVLSRFPRYNCLCNTATIRSNSPFRVNLMASTDTTNLFVHHGES